MWPEEVVILCSSIVYLSILLPKYARNALKGVSFLWIGENGVGSLFTNEFRNLIRNTSVTIGIVKYESLGYSQVPRTSDASRIG